jgi:hypothetical protein
MTVAKKELVAKKEFERNLDHSFDFYDEFVVGIYLVPSGTRENEKT